MLLSSCEHIRENDAHLIQRAPHPAFRHKRAIDERPMKICMAAEKDIRESIAIEDELPDELGNMERTTAAKEGAQKTANEALLKTASRREQPAPWC